MAENGFESNENYDYVVKALQHNHDNTIACLNIQGDGGRRKTAFANALAHSLEEIEHILYHDFTMEEEPPAPVYVKVDDEDEGTAAPPVSALDRTLSDACAFSEAERTILILDQLQAADFKDHIRLYKFLLSREWNYHDVSFHANRRNLLVFIISEEDVYHSLQKHSFRVWVDTVSDKLVPWKPKDFDLGPEAEPVMEALARLFDVLMVTPTYSEYKKILRDIPRCVHTAEDLANTVFGWTEGIDRSLLKDDNIQTVIEQEIMPAVESYIGVEDVVELTALPPGDDTLH